MRTWKQSLIRGVVTGSAASLASTSAITVFSRLETGRAATGSNATSQWVFGEPAIAHDAPSLKHTLTGYLIHHLMSIYWATLYERFRRDDGDRKIENALVDATAIAAVAAAVDFRLMQGRFTPGFEKRLSRLALVGIYGCFSLGLGTSSRALPRAFGSCAPR